MRESLRFAARARAVVALTLVVGCRAGDGRTTQRQSVSEDAMTPDERAVQHAAIVAIAQVESVADECSGAGGTHIFLRVNDVARGDAATVHTVHAGDHGVWATKTHVGDWFVAGIERRGWRSNYCMGNPDCSLRGWCLDALPETEGVAVGLIQVADLAAGKALVTRLQ